MLVHCTTLHTKKHNAPQRDDARRERRVVRLEEAREAKVCELDLVARP